MSTGKASLTGLMLSMVILGTPWNEAAAMTSVPDFYECNDRIDGTWEYGRVPSACDSSVYGPDSYVTSFYGSLVLNEEQYTSAELDRYMTEMYATITAAAAYYIQMRDPKVTAAEVTAWQSAVYAVLAQESMWSHFRHGTDGKLKITRGDSGHGFGLMQIDDRAFNVDVQSGEAWDLVGNIVLGLGVYYTAWEKAATASCVGASTDWENRGRAAYSYYNSGNDLCRWTNTSDAWASNDEGYHNNYVNKPWAAYIEAKVPGSSVNVECAIEDTKTEKTQCMTTN